MKKLQRIALVGVAVLLVATGLVSCSKKPAATSGGGTTTTLNVWHIHGQEVRKVAFESAARRFEAANPGVKVVISVYENDPYKTKLKTVTGDDFPDVFCSWGGGWLKSFVDAGLVADITQESARWESKINPSYKVFHTFGGKVYAAPYMGGSTVLAYNKELFAKAGIASFPATWDEFNVAAEKLKAIGVIPWALGNRSKWPGAQHFVLLSMRLGGADVFQRAIDGKTTFTDPAFIQAGNMLLDMVKKGYFPDGVNGINYDTGGSRMMLYTEQCAMIVQTLGFLSFAKSENLDFFNNKLALGTYPAIPGGSGKNTDMLGGENAFSVSAGSKNKELAVKLIEFYATDPQFQKEIVESAAVPAALGIVADDPLVAAAVNQIATASYVQNYIDQTLDPELAELHKDTTQALYGQTMTSQQAADAMQKAFAAQ
jgi:raffinose/stachyose/melibiose transport system substrate-binding protein